MTPIKIFRERPAGNRLLHEPVSETDAAVRFRYYGWLIWIPRSALALAGKQFSAPLWAIETAKAHKSAEQYRSEQEAMDRADALRGNLSRLHGSVFEVGE